MTFKSQLKNHAATAACAIQKISNSNKIFFDFDAFEKYVMAHINDVAEEKIDA